MSQNKQTAFRLPKRLLDRLDAHVSKMRREQPGLLVNRSDFVRMLLEKAILELETGPRKLETGMSKENTGK